MKRMLLDTSFLIRYLRRPKIYVTYLANCDEIILPAIVLGEYRAGLFPTKEGERNRLVLEEFMSKSRVRSVTVSERTAELYAKVYQVLKAVGRPIPQNDMWIAASALEHGADLVTCDVHFRAVPMLTVVCAAVED